MAQIYYSNQYDLNQKYLHPFDESVQSILLLGNDQYRNV